MTSGIFDLESEYQKRLIDYSAEITNNQVILVHFPYSPTTWQLERMEASNV